MLKLINYFRFLFLIMYKKRMDHIEKNDMFDFKEKPILKIDNDLKFDYDLMVIIPAYNVEKYIETCIESVLFQNTSYKYHVVVVNDGSTDSTLNLLNKYKNISNLTIINQENQGHSGARNTALKYIDGKYVMFVDSDDYLPTNAVQVLLDTAFNKNADLVTGGYKIFDGEKTFEEHIYNEKISQVDVYEIPGFTCMKIFKSQLLKDFCFPEGYLFEDTVISKLIYPICKVTFTVPEIIYFYRYHAQNISNTFDKSDKCLDTFWITKYCFEEAKQRGYKMDETQCKEYLKQCWVNYLRTRYLPEDVQKSIFVLTADMINSEWKNTRISGPKRLKMLKRAIEKYNYDAYLFILKRWEIF